MGGKNMSLWSKNQPCIPGGKLDFSECTTHLYSLLDLILKKKKVLVILQD